MPNLNAVTSEARFHVGRESDEFLGESGGANLIAAIEHIAKEALIAQTIAGELDIGGLGEEIGNVGAKERLTAEKEGAAAKEDDENKSERTFASQETFFGSFGGAVGRTAFDAIFKVGGFGEVGGG